MKKFILPLLLLSLMLPVACTEKDTSIGVELQDPTTLYDGLSCTITAGITGWSQQDDSLLTRGYSSGVIGQYNDPIYGQVTGAMFTQIGLPSTNGISFSRREVSIDSVKLNLEVLDIYPLVNVGETATLTLNIHQLSQGFDKDSAYYSFSQLPVGDEWFQSTVQVTRLSDSAGNRRFTPICVNLDSRCFTALSDSCSYDEFFEHVKGIRIAAVGGTLVTLNLAATNTRLSMFYHLLSSGVDGNYDFVINNSGPIHFFQYQHAYPASFFDAAGQINGDNRLYIEPLGGVNVKLDMEAALQTFHAQHPTAIIHHAELLLTVAPESDTLLPEKIMANKILDDGKTVYITDANYQTNPYSYSGYDGTYHADRGCYRMRITQHVQEQLRAGKDNGILLTIDARRSSGARCLFYGFQSANPPRIEFIYTE